MSDRRAAPPTFEKRPFELSKIDTATLYEGLVLLQMFFAKSKRSQIHPYDDESILRLEERLIEVWPELRSIYRGNRSERRAQR